MFLSLGILGGLGEMTVEFAKVAEVWHRFKADVIFITFCSMALTWADDSALLNGNALVVFSWGLGLLSEVNYVAR